MGYNKYGARKTTIDGISFASKLEADVYCHLLLLKKSNVIANIELQPTILLTAAKISYKADFRVRWGNEVWIEAKGIETDRWRLIKRLWKYYGPGMLQVYKANKRGVYLDEEIVPV